MENGRTKAKQSTLVIALLALLAVPSMALDPLCVSSGIFGLLKCPEESTDWYPSYEDGIDTFITVIGAEHDAGGGHPGQPSTTTFNAFVADVDASTNSLQIEIDTLDTSTISLQAQVDGISLSQGRILVASRGYQHHSGWPSHLFAAG